MSVTANATTGPDGEVTADQITSSAVNGQIEQAYDTGADLTNRTFTFSSWLRTTTATTAVSLAIVSSLDGTAGDEGSTSASTTYVAANQWQRFFVTGTFGTETDDFVKAKLEFPQASASTVYAWGAQLEEAANAGT